MRSVGHRWFAVVQICLSVLRVCVLLQAIVTVLESRGEKTFTMVLQLLQSLANSSVITADQISRVRRPPMSAWCIVCWHWFALNGSLFGSLLQGYDRVYADIEDINIDVPRAYFILEQFVEKSFKMGIIDMELRDQCPCR